MSVRTFVLTELVVRGRVPSGARQYGEKREEVLLAAGESGNEQNSALGRANRGRNKTRARPTRGVKRAYGHARFMGQAAWSAHDGTI
jgi:hypothetical protein